MLAHLPPTSSLGCPKRSSADGDVSLVLSMIGRGHALTWSRQPSRNPLRDQRQALDAASPPGGAERDRTDDLRLAKPALSQLSYSPR